MIWAIRSLYEEKKGKMGSHIDGMMMMASISTLLPRAGVKTLNFKSGALIVGSE